jgi:DNA-binding protein H-NS
MFNKEATMEIRINEMKKSEYGTVHMELACRKVTAYVGVNKDGSVQVCSYNASHKVWRGAGKYYRSMSEALEAFRSAEMKAIIAAAFDAITPANNTAH